MLPLHQVHPTLPFLTPNLEHRVGRDSISKHLPSSPLNTSCTASAGNGNGYSSLPEAQQNLLIIHVRCNLPILRTLAIPMNSIRTSTSDDICWVIQHSLPNLIRLTYVASLPRPYARAERYYCTQSHLPPSITSG